MKVDLRQSTIYGEFRSDYRSDRLSDLCEPDGGVQTGPFGSQLHQEDYVTVGTPIITVEHLGENRMRRDGMPRVSGTKTVNAYRSINSAKGILSSAELVP